MAEQIVAPRTHLFRAVDGRLLQVVEHEDGHHLEAPSGSIGLCRLTGPEILKLSAQGRALWNALNEALKAPEMFTDEEGAAIWQKCRTVLRATAQTFDHNEPESRTHCAQCGGKFGTGECQCYPTEAPPKRHDPNRPIPLVGPEEVDRADD